jgi:hypothetical protein
MRDSTRELIETFIIDCPTCHAKVAAIEQGRAERRGVSGDPFGEPQEPYATLVQVGPCPKCETLLVGESEQIAFASYESEYDQWSEVVRVHPKPTKVFASSRIPKIVKNSLGQAEVSLQGNAPDAACVMLGRALEAICRHLLELHKDPDAKMKPIVPKPDTASLKKPKKIMLNEGIESLKEKKLIDSRLYDWSKQLRAFRNFGAHPDEDYSATREDAEDLQAFVYAFTEYTYDLAERYEEFLDRQAYKEKLIAQKKKKK